LFPEVTASIVGQDFMREGDVKSAIDVLKLVVLAYPDSADAHDNLAGAHLKDGQKDFGATRRRKSTDDSQRSQISSIIVDRYRALSRRDSPRHRENSKAAGEEEIIVESL
jgi:hypothetical protein